MKVLQRIIEEFTSDGTSGLVSLFRLRVIGPNKAHGVRYQPIDPALFMRCFSNLHEDWSQFTFVDLGCGKGRALLLARELGFHRIIGVEFAPALVKIAQRNAPFAEVVAGDAGDYIFPTGPLVVFLFNPFDETVLANVLKHLPACYVTYLNPRHDDMFEHWKAKRTLGTESFSIWQVPG